MKKRLFVFVVMMTIFIFTFMYMPQTPSTVTVHAETLTLQQLKNKFPAGKYWNHEGNSTNNPDGYTSNPCTHHNPTAGYCSSKGYNGWCGCNSFGAAIQCFGFSNKLGYDAYGSNPTSWKQLSNMDSLKAGDVIRYKNDGHSIFVTAVNGNTITYADCNSDGKCKIRWDQTILKSDIWGFNYVLSAPKELSSASTWEEESGWNVPVTVTAASKTYVYYFGGGIEPDRYIDPGDECYIDKVYIDKSSGIRYVHVRYPISGGTRWSYAKLTDLPIPVSKPIVSSDSTKYKSGDTVKLTWKAVSGATAYWLDIWKDGKSIASIGMNTTTSYSLKVETGEYGVFVTGYNVVSSTVSDVYNFTVECSHNYSTEWTIDKKATCAAEGSKSHHCTVCDAKGSITAIPKTDEHKLGDWIVSKAPTKTAEGTAVRTCSVCGKQETKNIAKAPFNGNGTAKDPYQISVSDDLVTLSNLINNVEVNPFYRHCYYLQIADIDMGNKVFTPIGTFYDADGTTLTSNAIFAGNYDGQCHKITNLTVDYDKKYTGLFGRIGEAGGVDNSNCKISNLSIYGNISSTAGIVGGIAGEIGYGAAIENCSVNCNIKSSNTGGGVAGSICAGGTINACYFNGSVTGKDKVAGIVAHVNIGKNKSSKDAIVTNCYSTGEKITGNSNLGGVVSVIEDNQVIENACTIKNNYYLDTMISSDSNTVGGCTKTDSKSLKSYANKLGSPFVTNNNGGLNNGYPVFTWQIKNGDCNEDGELTVLDVVMLQKWLLGSRELTNWQNADLYEDGIIDVFDLCMMKRMLLEKNTTRYQVIDKQMTWIEAKEYCESVGGHLAVITSAKEQAIVEQILSKSDGFESYWIGGYVENDVWRWVTGEKFSYSNWAEDQPDGGSDEFYTQMFSQGSSLGLWDDTWNDGDHGGGIKAQGCICEWN